MKKKVFIISLSVLAPIAFLVLDYANRQCDESDLLLFSVEALSRDEGTSNTGPRVEKKCMAGGHRMVCLTMNQEACSDSECY